MSCTAGAGQCQLCTTQQRQEPDCKLYVWGVAPRQVNGPGPGRPVQRCCALRQAQAPGGGRSVPRALRLRPHALPAHARGAGLCRGAASAAAAAGRGGTARRLPAAGAQSSMFTVMWKLQHAWKRVHEHVFRCGPTGTVKALKLQYVRTWLPSRVLGQAALPAEDRLADKAHLLLRGVRW